MIVGLFIYVTSMRILHMHDYVSFDPFDTITLILLYYF